MQTLVEGYRIGRSLEPEHPFSTYSHPAYEAEASGRRVVLKLVRRTFPLRPESQRWYRELMQRAAQLRAPSLVPVLDAGITEPDAEPWYAMELVAGEALETMLRRGTTFAPAHAAAIVAQLAAAAAAGRAADIAPALVAKHVMIDGERALAWDFGIGRWLSRAHDLVQGQYTAPGNAHWTFDLTPADARGTPPAPSDDAAALALLAFRMLSGRYYWNAAHAAVTSGDFQPMPLLLEIIGGANEPAQARSPVALPAGFDDWFAACLGGTVASAEDAARTLPR